MALRINKITKNRQYKSLFWNCVLAKAVLMLLQYVRSPIVMPQSYMRYGDRTASVRCQILPTRTGAIQSRAPYGRRSLCLHILRCIGKFQRRVIIFKGIVRCFSHKQHRTVAVRSPYERRINVRALFFHKEFNKKALLTHSSLLDLYKIIKWKVITDNYIQMNELVTFEKNANVWGYKENVSLLL